ncbi:MAG: CHASE2 domain-containing protein [Mariprofundaceae bacterium]|nr:CHASE2 domain-containing protein [Mariprofundaceae bacterium]
MLQFIAKFIEQHQRWFGYPLIVAMALLAFSTALIRPDFIEQIELKSLDQRFKIRGPIAPDARVVIVAIDDNSLSEIGRWPWPRDRIADLVDMILNKYGAKAIGFDIVFSEEQANPLKESIRLLEKSGSGNRQVQAWLTEHQQSGNLDARLEKIFTQHRNRIVPGYFFYTEGSEMPEQALQQLPQLSGLMQPSAMTAEFTDDAVSTIPRMGAVEGNLPQLTKSADSTGFFNFFPDSDGTVRRIPLIAELDGYIYPSMALQTLRIFMDWPETSVKVDVGGVNEIRIGERIIRADHTGNMLLNHYGPGKTFTHISAVDLLSGEADADMLKDAVVVLGVTAVGVFDYRPSPYDSVFPGVEGHAVAISNILNNEEISRPGYLELAELVSVLILSLLCGSLVYHRGAVVQTMSIFGVPVLIVFISLWLFSGYGLWLKVSYLIVGILLSTIPITLLEYVVESRKRAFIHDAFSHYLAPEVVASLAEHPETLQLGGEERHMTAIFSDIASFSSFSEKLTPQELVHFLNIYLTAMSDIILKRGGTIDKYEGDAIIAFFGAPLDMPDHVTQCVLAALEQQKALITLRDQWKQEGYPEVHIRIGINDGPMVVGNMGTDSYMNYTMMGDHVNLASRLEGVCKVYRVPILMSRDTYLQVRDEIAATFVDRVKVVGRAQPVDLYQPLAQRDEISDDDLKPYRSYERAWSLMHQRMFDEAGKIFEQLVREYPDNGLYEVMLARNNSYIKTPPSQRWDGVTVLKSK